MPVEKVNLAQKLSLFQDHFSPKIVGAVNDCAVKVVKLRGEFLWHQHDEEDELFLVLQGKLRIRFRDGDVELSPGELLIVPRGVEHLPSAEEETAVLLVEPKSTLNTGNVINERTVSELETL